MRKLIDSLNVKLRGYYNYYGLVGNYQMLEKMDLIVKRLLTIGSMVTMKCGCLLRTFVCECHRSFSLKYQIKIKE